MKSEKSTNPNIWRIQASYRNKENSCPYPVVLILVRGEKKVLCILKGFKFLDLKMYIYLFSIFPPLLSPPLFFSLVKLNKFTICPK